jgi:hypothetical protein
MPVALFSHRAKAEPIQQRLAQAGIPAEIHDEVPLLERLWFVSKPESGVRIEVPAELFEKAEKMLLDWDAAEPILREAFRCPECKSLRVYYPQFARNSMMTNLGLGLAAEAGLVEKEFYCEDCHCTWARESTKARRQRQHLAPYYFIEGIELRTTPQVPASNKPPVTGG